MFGGRPHRGFALLITIVLIAFLVLILVALATLTRVETQVAANSQRASQARQNALMALNLALGELQRSAGSDRRVTATSNIGTATSGKSDTQPFLTGVWRHDPGVASDLPTLSYAPKLVSWLVSGNENMLEGAPLVTPEDVAALPLPDSSNDVVWLLGEKSVEFSGTASATNPEQRVRLRKQPIQAAAGVVPGLDATETPTIGHYAWWVGDEGVKARINLRDPFYGSADADEQKARLASVQRVRGGAISGFGPTAFPEDSTSTTRVVRTEQLPMLAPDVPSTEWRKNYHHVTVSSAGILTDTRNGGLRQDLGYLASQSSLASFQAALSTAFADITGSFNATVRATNLLSTPGVSVPAWMPDFFTVGADTVGPTWEQLWSFLRLPVDVDQAAGSIFPRTQTATRHGVAPVLLQVKMAFGLRSVPSATMPDRYNIQVHYFPLIVLGNPHSVALQPSAYHVNVRLAGNTVLRTGSTDRFVHFIGRFVNTTFKLEAAHAIPPGGASVFSLKFDDPSNSWEALPPSYLLPLAKGTKVTYTMVDDFSPDVSLRVLATACDPDGNPGPVIELTEAERDEAMLMVEQSSPGSTVGIGAFFWNHAPSNHETMHQIISRQVATKTNGPVTGTLAGGTDTFPGGGIFQRHLDANDTGQLFVGYMGEVDMRAPELTSTMSSGTDNASYPLYSDSNAILRSSRQYFDGATSGLVVRGDNRTVPWLLNYQPASSTDPFTDSAPLFHVPREPLNSLGQLQHFNATGYLSGAPAADGGLPGIFETTATWPAGKTPTKSLAYQPPYTIGRSRASMFIPRDQLARDVGSGGFHRDSSYLLNTALWDRFHLSSVNYSGAIDFGREDVAAVNRRYQPTSSGPAVPADQITTTTAAERLQILGALNVNSTSVEAWTAFLGGVAGVPFNDDVGTLESAFPRHLDLDGTADDAAGGTSANAWRGFRKLDAVQLRVLAEKIVEQVKLRGPFLSLSDFVNRRLIGADGDADLIGVRGAIAAAIEEAGLNQVTRAPYGDAPQATPGNVADAAHRQKHLITDFPGWLTQGDILQPLAPYLTARSDTFTIRAYGDVNNPVTGEIEGRAWCEAVVQRTVDFVEASQPASTPIPGLNSTNELFGRRFHIVSFRWLGPEDL